ncbi:octanoyltransferase [Solemya pervernicosa gill symbiont]|uniref:Octanoyltransferase n=2 Tax=Gammaproteobacteria incertae sedis TaxID=118884 RepID=A0A1T2L4D0_9GAMM|nr:lipoyl(octanoyl) transferase LipB [Candidatus Reidiella endopervernicosa]OOZ39922.1 octanoyltransferase [Solemya pervernicosa gill symbiont]QKQ25975.1 lipoyl(octanoyl) transferase LipB [Candidatus Reidiella endopervernicosa]
MQPVTLRRLGQRDYEPVWREMESFTFTRTPDTIDELWRVEHPPIFTLGLNGKNEHLLNPGDIPVINVDRGGQVTYHGPGQIVIYTLLDLRRLGIGVRELVTHLEQSIIALLADYDVEAAARKDAPGVYVAKQKIAALGLRVKRGCSYHGLSLNVDMELEPFSRINPCGYADMAVTQMADLGITASVDQVAERLLSHLTRELGYTTGRTEV